MNQYRAAKGSHLTDEEAQVYGDRIDTLIEELGFISPELILEDAQSGDSPLHDYFEWDDQKAGEEYRLHKARVLIKSINVVVHIDDREVEPRAYHRVIVTREDVKEREWHTLEMAINTPEERQQIILRALHELESWQRRYEMYEELGEVFAAVSKVKETLKI